MPNSCRTAEGKDANEIRSFKTETTKNWSRDVSKHPWRVHVIVLLSHRHKDVYGCCRTEFVVEKLLTNWLSLCMYDYLKKHVARAMFMLYKAIKHQTEKGPVDAVTCDARYALSEDRLLRENTECRPLVKLTS